MNILEFLHYLIKNINAETKFMKFGDKSQYVTSWQKFLISQGCLKAEPTGFFGEQTLAGTKMFQYKNGLESMELLDQKLLKLLKS